MSDSSGSAGSDLNDENKVITISDLGQTVLIYSVIAVIGLLYFEYTRRSNRAAYAARDRKAETRNALVEEEYGFLGWISHTIKQRDDEIIEYCGLDTMLFLRFQRLCLKIALAGMACAIFLFPVYATEEYPDGRDVDFLVYLTMGNLRSGSDRLYASIVAIYAMSFLTMYLIKIEYTNYINRRHEFLQSPNAHQYSILIDDLPENLMSNATLSRYMNTLFPKQVRCVYVALELGDLEKAVKEREGVRDRLEYALASKGKTGNPPTHKENAKCFCCGGNEVDSIETYQERLDALNVKIANVIRDVDARRARFESQLQSSPKHMDVTSFQKKKNDDGDDGYVELVTPDGIELEQESDGNKKLMRHSGFVSFTTLQAAQMAQQVLQSEKPFELTATQAPSTEDINWSNIGLTHEVKKRWKSVSNINTTLIVFFWTIPTAFVGGLSSVSSLKEKIGGLEEAIEDNPWIEDVLVQLAPLALVVMNALAPIIFKILSQKEGHSRFTEVEASLFSKLCWFQIIQMFFVAAISGSIFTALRDVADDPGSVAPLLGKSIPSQASLFMAYIVIQLGLSMTLELLRVVDRIVAFIHYKFAPQLTERQRTSPWLGLKPLACPEDFEQPKQLADNYLVLLLILVFSTLAPLLCFFGALYFAAADVVYRRQALFVRDPSPNSAGVFWPHIYRFMIVALLIAQITIVGVLGIKESGAAGAVIVLPIVTILFNMSIKEGMPRTATYLPLNECCRVDRTRADREVFGWEFLDDAYSQPALLESDPIVPESVPDQKSESIPVLESDNKGGDGSSMA